MDFLYSFLEGKCPIYQHRLCNRLNPHQQTAPLYIMTSRLQQEVETSGVSIRFRPQPFLCVPAWLLSAGNGATEENKQTTPSW